MSPTVALPRRSDPAISICAHAGRSASNFAENRSYPRVILTRWQPIYAGWGGGIKCA